MPRIDSDFPAALTEDELYSLWRAIDRGDD